MSGNKKNPILSGLLFGLSLFFSNGTDIASGVKNYWTENQWIQYLFNADCGAQLSMSHTYCPKCGVKITKILKEQEHRRQRVLPLDSQTLGMLKEYIERGGLVVKKGEKLIFGINRHRAWQIIKESAEKAGLPMLVNPETGKIHNVSPHRLRDAFATHAVKVNDTGDGLRMLQEHLGHASFNTTARYRKVSGQEHKAWYQKLWGTEEHDKSEA